MRSRPRRLINGLKPQTTSPSHHSSCAFSSNAHGTRLPRVLRRRVIILLIFVVTSAVRREAQVFEAFFGDLASGLLRCAWCVGSLYRSRAASLISRASATSLSRKGCFKWNLFGSPLPVPPPKTRRSGPPAPTCSKAYPRLPTHPERRARGASSSRDFDATT